MFFVSKLIRWHLSEYEFYSGSAGALFFLDGLLTGDEMRERHGHWRCFLEEVPPGHCKRVKNRNEEEKKSGDGVESERDKRVSAKCRIFVRRTSGPPTTKKESFLSVLGQKKIR